MPKTKRVANKLPYELTFEAQMKKIKADKKAQEYFKKNDVVFCPTCKRGYLLEEEKEMIKAWGFCYACMINIQQESSLEEHLGWVKGEVEDKDYVSQEEKRNYKDLPF